jgi:hypothetical protein
VGGHISLNTFDGLFDPSVSHWLFHNQAVGSKQHLKASPKKVNPTPCLLLFLWDLGFRVIWRSC